MNGKFGTRVIVTVVLVAVTCVAALEPREAEAAPEVQTGLMTPASSLAVVSNATVTSTASVPLWLPARDGGLDLVLEPMVTAAAAGTNNTVFGLNLSVDGSTFTTTLPLTLTLACNGTNMAVGHFIISRTNLICARAVRWDSTSTTQTNAVTAALRWAFVPPPN